MIVAVMEIKPKTPLYGERFDKIIVPWKSPADIPEDIREWVEGQLFCRVTRDEQIVWAE